MKHNFLKTSNKIIAFILGLLGFSAGCLPVAEYGVPSANFILNGNIKSTTTEQPINNIKVTMRSDTAISDENGTFSIKINDFPENQTYNVTIEDIDSIQNGHFENKDTTVTFPDNNFVGGEDDDWYEGETQQNISIYLDDKEK